MGFKFEVKQRVRVVETGDIGEVRTRLWHDTIEKGCLVHAYVVRCRRGNGTAVDAWRSESQLEALPA